MQVGVKTDFPPFGQLNRQGQAEGFEIDLAADIAKQLGVKLTTISITTENRFQKLEQGDVDILIATVGDTAERRQIATAVEPNYYAGGVSVFLRPGQRVADWQAMRGQKICATQGAYFNRPMSQRYLLDLVMYKGTRDALLALRDGRCIGFLYSSAAVQAYLKKPEWAGYTAPLPLAMVAPWAINVSRKESGSELDQMLGNVVAQWHRSGFLIETEQKWGIQPVKFLKDAKSLWTQRDDQENLICHRDVAGHWPTTCRNPAFVRSDEVGGLLRLGLWLQESTGLNLTFVYDPYDRSVIIKGAGVFSRPDGWLDFFKSSDWCHLGRIVRVTGAVAGTGIARHCDLWAHDTTTFADVHAVFWCWCLALGWIWHQHFGHGCGHLVHELLHRCVCHDNLAGLRRPLASAARRFSSDLLHIADGR
ncbi:MAG: transporter substrate-binding domain-containing protein [Comamonadaceae bacterium]|nr:transporter substrate-binding domain-containing protein [Comamonadaceae bacterium]